MTQPARYRKRPVEVDAVLLDPATPGLSQQDVIRWVRNGGGYASAHPQGVRIEALEGEMLATFGDYVIRGVQGEHYPCKPDIFAATYEER